MENKSITKNDLIFNLDIYTELLVKNKVIGFKGLNPSKEEAENIVLNLCSIEEVNEDVSKKEFHWIENFNHQYLESTELLKSNEEILDFKNWCMHVDIPPILNEESSNLDISTQCAYVSMIMRKFSCDSKYGKTVFLDLAHLYAQCPKDFLPLLELATFEHHRDKKNYDFNPDIQKAKQIPGTFSPIRIHPITKEKILFWPSYMNVEINGNKEDWFYEFKLWVKTYLDEEGNWVNWEWSEGDLLIWDNRALLHSFTPGWKHNERIFDQLVVGYQMPLLEKSQ